MKIVFILLLVLHLSEQFHHKHKQHSRKKILRRRFKQNYDQVIFRNPVPNHFLSADDIAQNQAKFYISEKQDNQNKMNKKISDEYYEKHPGGVAYDKSGKEIENFQMSTLCYLQRVNQIDTIQDQWRKELIYLNDMGTIYFMQKEGDIRTVQQGINLLKRVSRLDDIPNGKCCTFINNHIKRNIQPPGLKNDQNEQLNIHCIELYGAQSKWMVCKENVVEASELMKMVKKCVIRAYYKSVGQKQFPYLEKSDPIYENQLTWSYDRQDEWDGYCRSSRVSSPINVDPQYVKPGEHVVFTIKSNGPVQAQSDFKGQQIKIVKTKSKFGNLEFAINKSWYDLDIYAFKFKFPSEHSINGEFYDGELQLQAKSEFDEFSIISIFLKGSQIKPTQFWKDLDIDNWKPLDERFPAVINLKNPLDIDQIVQGGFNSIKKDFYFYQGTYNVPNCAVGLFWILIKNPIEINFEILQQMKQNNYSPYWTNLTNTNRKQTFNDGLIYLSSNTNLDSHYNNVVLPDIEQYKKDLGMTFSEENLELSAQDQLNNLQNDNQDQSDDTNDTKQFRMMKHWTKDQEQPIISQQEIQQMINKK